MIGVWSCDEVNQATMTTIDGVMEVMTTMLIDVTGVVMSKRDSDDVKYDVFG